MNKALAIIAIIILLFIVIVYLAGMIDENMENGEAMENFIRCLDDAGVAIYGAEGCPACNALIKEFGGYEMISPIYIECMKEDERCSQEMKTGLVPEVQIGGELFEKWASPEVLAEETGCKL